MRQTWLCTLVVVAAFACGGDDDGNGGGDVASDAAGGTGGDAGTGADGGAGSADGGGEPGKVCGGLAGMTCADADYCDWEAGSCGAGDDQGTCVPRPRECGSEGPPVCGCDGQSYKNKCAAAMVGQDIAEASTCGT